MLDAALLHTGNLAYRLLRPLIFTRSAQASHNDVLRLLRWADGKDWVQTAIQSLYRQIFPSQPVTVGGVDLPHPFLLAAGFVKGDGFQSEAGALAAVQFGENIIPGWRTMPALVGPVEFGSFTRWPRTGNPGTVIWRDRTTHSTQNRVGLKNPGVQAAAAFLATRDLPPVFGINIAPSPGLDTAQADDIRQSLDAFHAAGVRPNWFTLNLSCPNTEDDPEGRQTEAQAQALSRAAVSLADGVPVWVKVGPGLSAAQYHRLMQVFAADGVQAVVATNTWGQPTPDGTHTAGIGGGRLQPYAIRAVGLLAESPAPVDVIGCGGVLDPASYHAMRSAGAKAVQYWSALVYRGPLAAASILQDDQERAFTDGRYR
jgi:dihydroorotate dehydrogenase